MKYAIYDMSLHAPAFDFVQFCIISKSRCAAMGEECYIIFKMGPDKGFKEPNDKPYTVEEKRFRMTHIMYPICTMMGLSYATGMMHGLEKSKTLYPKNDSFILKQILEQYKETPFFWPQPSDYAMEMVRNIFSEKPIVITLRETYAPGRNSDIKEWLKFGKYVKETNNVIFVRDTRNWNARLSYGDTQFNTFPTASVDLDIRLALYKHAKMNFSVGGGPTSLLRFSVDNPYRAFKLVVETKSGPIKHINSSDFAGPGIQIKSENKPSIVLYKKDVMEHLRKGRTKITARDTEGNIRIVIIGDKDQVKEIMGNRPASAANWTENGLPPGSQFPWHTKDQKIIWEDDTFEVLKNEYDEWMKYYG